MIQHILKYSLLLGLVFIFASCDRTLEPVDYEGAPVYLKISRGSVSRFRSPSLPSAASSINSDKKDYEDGVHSISLLIFEADDEGKLAGSYFNELDNNNTSGPFIVKLTPGERDFYFIANMPMGDLWEIKNRAAMDQYMADLKELDSDLYTKATKDKGFPMSRVYKKQEILEGGTIDNPLPFKPNGEDYVNFIRTVAKLVVMIPVDEVDALKSIKLKNAFKEYHFMHGNIEDGVAQSVGKPNAVIKHADDVVLQQQESASTDEYIAYVAYLPEALMSGALWSASSEHKPINYIELETLDGVVRKVPIITATTDDYGSNENYLNYATTTYNSAVYNLYRNRRYFYRFRHLSQIEIEYNIEDWNEVPYTLYMGHGYNVIIDEDGLITVENTIDDCMPHKVILEAVNGAYFGEETVTRIEYGYDYGDEVDPQKMKAGYSETYDNNLLNNSEVTKGKPYLNIYYNYDGQGNRILVKTYTK